MNANTVLFRISLLQKLFQSCKNICFEAIKNGDKSEWSGLIIEDYHLHFWQRICTNHMRFTTDYAKGTKKHVRV